MTCQSVMQPSTAEYWHIGAMTMRLVSSRAPTRNGVNSALILSSPYSRCSVARENFLTASRKNIPELRGDQGKLVCLSPCRITGRCGRNLAPYRVNNLLVANRHLIGVTRGVLSGSNRSLADKLVDAAEKSRCLSRPYHPGGRGPRARNRHRFRTQPSVLFTQRGARDRPRTLAEALGHGTPSRAHRQRVGGIHPT